MSIAGPGVPEAGQRADAFALREELVFRVVVVVRRAWLPF
jgi:hypothetical protein